MKREEIEEIFSMANAIIVNDHFVYAQKPDGWYHGSAYINKDAIYPYVRSISKLCEEVVKFFIGKDIQVVVGPTIGAVSLSQWVAYHLAPSDDQEEVLAVYAEEEPIFADLESGPEYFLRMLASDFKSVIITGVGKEATLLETAAESKKLEAIHYQLKTGTRRILRRGYDKIVKGKRCLVVEDVINSGATVQKTIEAIRNAGGDVVGVGALCNRSGGAVTEKTFRVPVLHSLLNIYMEMFKEDDCPICKERGEKSVRLDLGKGKEFLIRKGLSITE